MQDHHSRIASERVILWRQPYCVFAGLFGVRVIEHTHHTRSLGGCQPVLMQRRPEPLSDG